MFPTPNPRNGLILSPVRQVTILHAEEFADLAQSGERQTEVRTSVSHVLSGGPVFDPQNSQIIFLPALFCKKGPSVSLDSIITDGQVTQTY